MDSIRTFFMRGPSFQDLELYPQVARSQHGLKCSLLQFRTTWKWDIGDVVSILLTSILSPSKWSVDT